MEELIRNWAAWYHAGKLVCDPTQAESMVERLKLPAVAFTGSPAQQNEAARAVYQGFRDGGLDYPDTEGLLEDFLHMQIVEKGVGQVRIEFDQRGADGHGDVGQAVVMGIWYLASQPASTTGSYGGLEMARASLDLDDDWLARSEGGLGRRRWAMSLK